MSLEIRDSSTALSFAWNDKASEVFIEVLKAQ